MHPPTVMPTCTAADRLWSPNGAIRLDQARWFVVHTRARQELALARHLAAARVQHFLPLTPRVRYVGRAKRRTLAPLFPGYVFLFGTREQAWLADRSPRVARVLPVADQDRLRHDLAQIRLALERNAPLQPAPCLTAGRRVEVTAGPFRGLQGLIDRDGRDDRLVLQVRFLGRAAQLEIDRSLLQPID